MRYQTALLTILSLAATVPASAEPLARRVIDAPDGRVRISFPSRSNVCGYEDVIRVMSPSGKESETRTFRGGSAGAEQAAERCAVGPVRVELTVRGNRVERVHTRVASEFASAPGRVTNLGAVPVEDAVAYLLDLAPRVVAANGDDALLAVALAAGPSPAVSLLQIAENGRAPVRMREDAVYWAAETGADVAQLRMVYDRVGDARVREQILFAYSRAEDQASTRELLRVARGKGNLELRKRAVFWLGQKTDPEITLELGNLVSTPKLDARVREHAILVLSQRPVEEGVPALIHIARNNPDRRLRERAIALLGSSGDPRAVELYESSLTRE